VTDPVGTGSVLRPATVTEAESGCSTVMGLGLYITLTVGTGTVTWIAAVAVLML